MLNKPKITAFFLVCSLAVCSLLSCASESIVGYYTAERLNNVYYFSDDGRIFENYSDESTSFYEINGNIIKLYNSESKEDLMQFKFKKTKNGFLLGNRFFYL